MENLSKLSITCTKLCNNGICKNDCCGIVPISNDIIIKHIDKIDLKRLDKTEEFNENKIIVTHDGKCIFLKENKCMIYEDRPKVCKDYGLIEELQCPYIKINGNERSIAQIKREQRKINHYVDNVLNILKR